VEHRGVWLAQLGTHTGYVGGVVGPIIVSGIGMGIVFAPAINAGTFGVAPKTRESPPRPSPSARCSGARSAARC
jgi:hypothetical protein